MLGLAQAVHASRKAVTAKHTFSLDTLRRLAIWGVTAASALLVVVVASQSEVGAERFAGMLHGGRQQVAMHSFDAQAETHRLAEAVRGLATDDDQIKSRLAAVEQDMDGVTGSIAKQIEATDAARRAADLSGPTITATARATESLAPVGPSPAFVATTTAQPAGTPIAAAHTEYGVDIGSGLTIQALRARWLAIYSAHAPLFEGLVPILSVKEIPHGNRVELRLVAGPLPRAGAAAQLCAALTPFGLYCQPTIFDGQRLALQ